MQSQKQINMQKIKFTLFSLKDIVIAFGPMVLMILVVCGLAYKLVDPAPPRSIDFSTGQENSAYEGFAKRYAEEMAKNQITLTLHNSEGSQENLQRISDPDSEIEIGFVQSGSTDETEAQSKGLVSLGSLFYEPIWIFYRSNASNKELNSIAQFKGKTINVGTDGMGVSRLFKQI